MKIAIQPTEKLLVEQNNYSIHVAERMDGSLVMRAHYYEWNKTWETPARRVNGCFVGIGLTGYWIAITEDGKKISNSISPELAAASALESRDAVEI